MTNDQAMAITELPERIARLPKHGLIPIPFFTLMVDGKPNFRFHDPARHDLCMRDHLCGVCGESILLNSWFLLGPMNRALGGPQYMPAMHEDCARWSARLCPFLLGQRERRAGADMGLPPERPAELWLVQTSDYECERLPGVDQLYATPGARLSEEQIA